MFIWAESTFGGTLAFLGLNHCLYSLLPISPPKNHEVESPALMKLRGQQCMHTGARASLGPPPGV